MKTLLSCKKPPTLNQLSKQYSISSKTAHTWKHKFLSSLIEINNLDLSGKVEMELVFIPFSTKGKQSLRQTDNEREAEKTLLNSNQYSCFLCLRTPANGDFDFYPIQVTPGKKINKDNIDKTLASIGLPFDAHVVFKKDSLIEESINNIELKRFTSVEQLDDIKQIMNNFEAWTKSFNGFSTKYIWNYLKWFKLTTIFSNNADTEDYLNRALNDSKGWVRFMMINHYYREFMEVGKST